MIKANRPSRNQILDLVLRIQLQGATLLASFFPGYSGALVKQLRSMTHLKVPSGHPKKNSTPANQKKTGGKTYLTFAAKILSKINARSESGLSVLPSQLRLALSQSLAGRQDTNPGPLVSEYLNQPNYLQNEQTKCFSFNGTLSLLFVNFITVEEKPILDAQKNIILIVVRLVILVVGLLVNIRIYKILAKRSKAAAMDKLLKSNNIISLFTHPLILVYYIASNTVAPVSDYIGVTGCLLTVHLLDAFTRFYNFTFPVAVALLRYLFVVEHMKIKARGKTR